MAGKILVTLGTDGLSDWVQMSDGQKLMLGPISALKFVTEVGTGGAYGARKTLDDFIKDGSAMLTVDEDRLAELLKPHRARWTSVRPPVATPLIPREDRHPSSPRTARTEVTAMDYEQAVKEAISNQVARIEAQIAQLQTNAKEASPGSITDEQKKKDIESLKDMVAFLRRPSVYGNQSDNSTYYGLPEKLPDGASARSKEASINENARVARSILGTLRATEEQIDKLVLAGKKFDVARAKGDLHKVAKNVQVVVQHPKFKEAGRDVVIALHELGKRATQIHGLFATAKV
jgi:hypothetical protein